MKLLLEPLVESLLTNSTSGLVLKTPEGMKTFRARLVMMFFDLPAKAPVLCAKQFSREYGCAVYTHLGECLVRAHIYLPHTYPERTHESVLRAGVAAQRSGCAVEGVGEHIRKVRESRYDMNQGNTCGTTVTVYLACTTKICDTHCIHNNHKFSHQLSAFLFFPPHSTPTYLHIVLFL